MDILQERLIERNPNCWYHEVCTRDNKCTLCNKYTEMKFLMENSNLPKSKQQVITLNAPKVDRDAYVRLGEIKSDIYDFVQQGKNLYLGSTHTGNGKSSWAIKLMHKYFEEVWDGNGMRERALFINVPNFLMQSKDFGNKNTEFEHIKSLLREIDLVVWDDIASTNLSSYDYGQIFPYIDHRLLAEKSNIYTANFTDKQSLMNVLGERMGSRVWSQNTEVIIFNSQDLR